MEKQKKKQKGITLIALVISIIVMLILAGVSLNMTIGENGIISQAQEATYAQSVAQLEEFLQQCYVDNYDSFSKEESKIVSLENIYPEYFYIPSNEGIGALRYIVNSDGNALYLVKKSGLPKEIKNAIKGGNAGDGSFSDYQSMKDVYGVTSDLNVYYSSGEGELLGIASEELDLDNPLREVFTNTGSASEMYNFLKSFDVDGNQTLTAEEIKAIKTLTINSTSGITSLKDLYNLTSLRELIIENKEFNDLDGIQNCSNLYYIFFKNSTIGNYSALCGNATKLQYLYMYSIDDNELRKLVDGIKNTGFSKLNYLGFVGNISYLSEANINYSTSNSSKVITNLAPLEELNEVTKKAVTYLNLQNNNITDTKDSNEVVSKYQLEYISGFTNVEVLRVECNSISKLVGIEGMENLRYLIAANNKLGIYDGDNYSESNSIYSISNLSNLRYLNLRKNENLIWINDLNNLNLSYLGLLECNNMADISVASIRTIINKLGSNCEYPTKYWLSLLDEDTTNLSLSKQTITKEQLLTLGTYTNLKVLDLNNLSITESNNLITNQADLNVLVNSTLNNLTQLTRLRIKGLNISDISFVKNTPNLIELDCRETSITTELKDANGNNIGLELLEEYCTSLTSLQVDYQTSTYTTNLAKIPNTTKRCLESGVPSVFEGAHTGLYTNNIDILITLNSFTNIKRISFSGISITSDKVLDLSKNTELTNFSANQGTYGFKIKFPSSLTFCYTDAKTNDYDFSLLNNSSLILSFCNSSQDSYCQALTTINDTVTISELKIKPGTFLTGTDFSVFKKIYEERGNKKVKIDNLTLLTYASSNNRNNSIVSLSGIEYIDGLKHLIINEGLPNLFDISAISNHKNTLIELNLKNASISSCKGLEDLTKLQTLNLENNCIYDTATDSNGTIYNVEILASLHSTEKGSLENLYLANNNGIINYTPVSSLSWNKKSGF